MNELMNFLKTYTLKCKEIIWNALSDKFNHLEQEPGRKRHKQKHQKF